MAHLWVRRTGEWVAQRLDGGQPGTAAVSCDGGAQARAGGAPAARFVRAGAGGAHAWALVAPKDSNTRVNGRAVLAGLRVLADRDEIRTADGERHFFSTETLASVEEFPSPDRPVFCGRCRQQIDVGSPAVCCPSCGVWYNQSSELPCWTYSDKCTFCDQLTALDSGFTWMPEE